MSLIITIAPPGAGKSTWADSLPSTRLRLERDRFREAIFGSRKAYHDHVFPREQVSLVIGSAMYAAMRAWPNQDAVMSDTGLHYGSVKRFIEYARAVWQTPILLKVFDVDAATLHARNDARCLEHKVPSEYLDNAINEFTSPKAWWRNSGYHQI